MYKRKKKTWWRSTLKHVMQSHQEVFVITAVMFAVLTAFDGDFQSIVACCDFFFTKNRMAQEFLNFTYYCN